MGYASLSDLYTYGAPATAFGSLSDATKQAALDAASVKIDEHINARYALPLVSWPSTFPDYAARIATYQLLSVRGFNPASGADVNVRDRYLDAMRELVMIQKQQLHPNVTPAANQSPTYDQPVLLSNSVENLASGGAAPNRGW